MHTDILTCGNDITKTTLSIQIYPAISTFSQLQYLSFITPQFSTWPNVAERGRTFIFAEPSPNLQRTFVYLLLPSFTFFYLRSPSFTFLCLLLPSFIFFLIFYFKSKKFLFEYVKLIFLRHEINYSFEVFSQTETFP